MNLTAMKGATTVAAANKIKALAATVMTETARRKPRKER